MRIIRYTYFILSIILVWTFFSCADEIDSHGTRNTEEANIYITITTPPTSLPTNGNSALRSVDEFLIKQVHILVFEKINDEYLFQYQTDGKAITNLATDKYKFDALLSKTENPAKIYLVANIGSQIPYIEKNSTEAEVKENIILSFSADGLESTVPMTGEIEFPDGITDGENIAGKMLRAIARVDVMNNADGFVLTSVQLYRANNQLQVIPDEKIPETGGITSPSIPNRTQAVINTNPVFVKGKTYSKEEIYLPESAMPTTDNRLLGATCVVIGGVFGSDRDTTYYRMDFIPDSSPELWGQILRNHKYIFNIKTVSGSGWRTPDEAAENLPSNLGIEIKEWNEETVYMDFDGQHHLGVSAREVSLRDKAGVTSTIDVDTDLSDYQLYWLDTEGNKIERIPTIGWGESTIDDEDIFTVKVSSDGTEIIITANQNNNTGAIRTKQILMNANRLQVTITIHQEIESWTHRSVYVYGSLTEIGRLTDDIFGISSTPDRSRYLLPLLKSTSNYGLGGKVDFEGFIFGGRFIIEINSAMAGMFDVIYMTYGIDPSENTATVLDNWLKTDENRVLYIQYDNTSTNKNVLKKFGVTDNYQSSSLTSFKIHPDAPTKILNGPFGKVNPDMQYRCYDTTHGEIPLATALANNITPILIGGGGGVVLGIDMKRHIIYSGDIDLGHNMQGSSSTGLYLSGNGVISNDADILIANLWAWIAETVLTD